MIPLRRLQQLSLHKTLHVVICAHLLNAKPGLLLFALRHDLRAGSPRVGGNGLHVDVLAIDVPGRLVGVRHDNNVVTTAEGILR